MQLDDWFRCVQSNIADEIDEFLNRYDADLVLQYINAIDENSESGQRTALLYLIRQKNLQGVQLLLDYGADPNLGYYGNSDTALTMAVKTEQSDIVELLLQHKADIACLNIHSNSIPLSCQNFPYSIWKYIVIHNDVDLIEAFLNAHGQSSINAILTINSNRYTALEYMTSQDNYSGVELLLQHDAWPNVYISPTEGHSALVIAAQHNNLPLVNLILQHYPNVYVVDNNDHTSLDYAIEYQNYDMMEVLIQNGAANSLYGEVFMSSIPLHFACYGNNFLFAKWLLDKGFDINQCDYRGITSLHFVKDINILSLLLEYGVSILPLTEQSYGTHPLTELIKSKAACAMTQRLIDSGCDVNEDNGHPAWIHINDQVDVLSALLSAGVDLDFDKTKEDLNFMHITRKMNDSMQECFKNRYLELDCSHGVSCV